MATIVLIVQPNNATKHPRGTQHLEQYHNNFEINCDKNITKQKRSNEHEQVKQIINQMAHNYTLNQFEIDIKVEQKVKVSNCF